MSVSNGGFTSLPSFVGSTSAYIAQTVQISCSGQYCLLQPQSISSHPSVVDPSGCNLTITASDSNLANPDLTGLGLSSQPYVQTDTKTISIPACSTASPTTLIPSPITPPLELPPTRSCPEPAPNIADVKCLGGVWTVEGNAIIESATNVSVIVAILGNISFSNTSQLVLGAGGLISATGCIQLGGALTLVIPDLSNSTGSYAILNSTCITGSFDPITISSPDELCERFGLLSESFVQKILTCDYRAGSNTTTTLVANNQLSVVFSMDRSLCNLAGSPPEAAPLWIIAVVFAALVVVASVIVIVIWIVRRRRRIDNERVRLLATELTQQTYLVFSSLISCTETKHNATD